MGKEQGIKGTAIMTIASMLMTILLSFTGYSNAHEEVPDPTRAYTYSLYDVVEVYGYASTVIQGSYSGYSSSFSLQSGNGVFYGQCIEVEITSEVEETLSVEVGVGSRLECDDYEVQNMMVTGSYSFSLYSYQTKVFNLYAMCINMHKCAPQEGIYYEIGYPASGHLLEVAQAIESSDDQNVAGQCAVWAVTDDADGDVLVEMGATEYQLTQAQGILDDADLPYTLTESIDDGEDNGRKSADEGFCSTLAISALVCISVPLLFASLLRRQRGKDRRH